MKYKKGNCDFFVDPFTYEKCNNASDYVTVTVLRNGIEPIVDYSCQKHYEMRIRTFNENANMNGDPILPSGGLFSNDWFLFDYSEKKSHRQVVYILMKRVMDKYTPVRAMKR